MTVMCLLLQQDYLSVMIQELMGHSIDAPVMIAAAVEEL